MYNLFELDEHYEGTSLYEIEDISDPNYPEKHIAGCFNARLLDDLSAICEA